MTFDDPADAWAAYCFETPRDRRSPQGALAFGFHAAPSHDADLVKALATGIDDLEFVLKELMALRPGSYRASSTLTEMRAALTAAKGSA